MSLVIKLVSATIKQKIDTVIKNPYFKLLANNIILSILKKFFLEKIDSNIKMNIFFLHSLIWEKASVKIVNIADYDSDTSATTLFATNSKKNLYFYIVRTRTMSPTNIVQTINQVKV